jgi:hypothetical protein
MNISHFDELLAAARLQPQSQRLLLVLATTELTEDATPAQRLDYEQGFGGALVPAMCVDMAPNELTNFAAMQTQASHFKLPWKLLFASSLSGSNGQRPPDKRVQEALERMVEAIKQGAFGNMIAFDTTGQAVQLG